MIQYDYDIKEFRTKRNRKIIIFDIVIVLLTLFLAIYFGMQAAKSTYNTAENEVPQEEIVEETQEVEKTVLTSEQIQKVYDIYKGEEKIAYLTFDDGPSEAVTPLILDLLKQEQIKATFFLLGNRVERYPELVKRAYEEGHYIANHGYTHRYSNIYQSVETVIQEYEQTEKVIQNALGIENYHTNLFRFPGGSIGGTYHDIKQQAVDALNSRGIAHINWNALTEDAVGSPTKEMMMEKLKGTIEGKNVVVILLHDAGDKILTYELLPEIIQYLRENGYTFKSFADILV